MEKGMKDRIESCTKALIEAVKDSDDYKEFERSKEKLREYPELKVQIDQFRKRVYVLQNSDSSIDLLDEMEHLLQERRELYKNSLIASYLVSELHLCRMLQRIGMELFGVTDMEIDAFEDAISI